MERSTAKIQLRRLDKNNLRFFFLLFFLFLVVVAEKRELCSLIAVGGEKRRQRSRLETNSNHSSRVSRSDYPIESIFVRRYQVPI